MLRMYREGFLRARHNSALEKDMKELSQDQVRSQEIAERLSVVIACRIEGAPIRGDGKRMNTPPVP